MVVGFVGVEFMVVHMVVGANVLIKSACSLKAGYLHSACFGQALVLRPKEWHVQGDMNSRAVQVFFLRCPMYVR